MNKKILVVVMFCLIFILASTTALASLTLSTNAVTANVSSTIDVGSGNTLSLQTTNNGPITIGTGLVTLGGSLVASIIRPPTDSTTAIKINKADGTTNVLNIDTTNGRVGIGTTAPTAPLDVNSLDKAVTSSVTSNSTLTTGTPIGMLSFVKQITNSNTSGQLYGMRSQAYIGNTGDAITISGASIGALGISGEARYRGSLHQTTPIVGVRGLADTTSTGTTDNVYALYAGSPGASGGGITNIAGLYISQMNLAGITNAYGIYQSSTGDINYLGGNTTFGSYIIRSTTAGIIAGTTQTQAGATALTKDVNQVSTANSNDGVRLPVAVAGMQITIINSTANTIKIYPATGGTIDGQTQNSATTLATLVTDICTAYNTTNWECQKFGGR